MLDGSTYGHYTEHPPIGRRVVIQKVGPDGADVEVRTWLRNGQVSFRNSVSIDRFPVDGSRAGAKGNPIIRIADVSIAERAGYGGIQVGAGVRGYLLAGRPGVNLVYR